MPKFDHAYTIAFSVISEDENGEDVTHKMLLKALRKRIQELNMSHILDPISGESMLDACETPYDTFEVDPEPIPVNMAFTSIRTPPRQDMFPTPPIITSMVEVPMGATHIDPMWLTDPVKPGQKFHVCTDAERAHTGITADEERQIRKFMENLNIGKGEFSDNLIKVVLALLPNPKPAFRDRSNSDRVDEAFHVMTFFGALTGLSPDPLKDGPETVLSDLLAHLMHFADKENISFLNCVDRAGRHFTAEVADEADAAKHAAEAMNNELVDRVAPRWAWDIIDETLRMDANSKAFDEGLRKDINAATTSIEVACGNSDDMPIGRSEVDELLHLFGEG